MRNATWCLFFFIGITFPSKDCQSALMKDVYKRAKIKTDDIAYMELHSTGTPVSSFWISFMCQNYF